MSKNKVLALSLMFVIGSPAQLVAEAVRQHDSHEHGVSKLKIAIDNNDVQFILVAPGTDIVGFEHKPENSQQKASVTKALELLRKPEKLFEMPLVAGCSITSIQTKFTLEKEQEPEILHGQEDEHAEFHATYLFSCSSPQDLKTIGIQFFDRFPNSAEIELQAISNFGQLSAEISNDQRVIDLSAIVK